MNKHTFRKRIERSLLLAGAGAIVVSALAGPNGDVSVLYAMNRFHFLQIDTSRRAKRQSRWTFNFISCLFFHGIFPSHLNWLLVVFGRTTMHPAIALALSSTVVSQSQIGRRITICVRVGGIVCEQKTAVGSPLANINLLSCCLLPDIGWRCPCEG